VGEGKEYIKVHRRKERVSAFNSTYKTYATIAAYQHNYSSPWLRDAHARRKAKYYIQMRSKAAPVSKVKLAKAKGVAVPPGRRMAEVEGCKFIGERCKGEQEN